MCVGEGGREGGREGTRDGGKGGVKEICQKKLNVIFFFKLNIAE